MTKCGGSHPTNTLYCSFCGKSQHEVRKLIAGPTVFICNECVHACMDIIQDNKVAADEPKNSAASFHFSEAHIVRLDLEADFLATERQMGDLVRQWDKRREDDRLLDLYWGLYSTAKSEKRSYRRSCSRAFSGNAKTKSMVEKNTTMTAAASLIRVLSPIRAKNAALPAMAIIAVAALWKVSKNARLFA